MESSRSFAALVLSRSRAGTGGEAPTGRTRSPGVVVRGLKVTQSLSEIFLAASKDGVMEKQERAAAFAVKVVKVIRGVPRRTPALTE